MKEVNDASVLVRFLGDNPYIRVIDFLIDNIGFDYSKTEIARGSGIGWSTLYGVWNKLEDYKLIVPTRRYGKTQLYKINDKSLIVKQLLALEMDLIEMTLPHSYKQKIAMSV